MILEILKAPDKRLNIIAQNVDDGHKEETKTIIDNMFETMYHYGGIGLSATQVDIHKRILVMDVSGKICMINPEIIDKEEFITISEGCLSFPNTFIEKQRSRFIYVKYLDSEFRPMKRGFTGLEAVCVQHEIDHLNGITFDMNNA